MVEHFPVKQIRVLNSYLLIKTVQIYEKKVVNRAYLWG